MADPLSILGAALGVTSLVMQLTDECVKGFKFYSEAANLPETYRYLSVRLQIEQQRFLTFGLEAGILYADGTLCNTLHVHRSLLIAVLAEIKTVMENYASVNGKYEYLNAQESVDWNDKIEPELDIMRMLSPPYRHQRQAPGESDTGLKATSFQRIRKYGRNIAQTGRTLRNIIVEPRRLVWAAVDKDSFEQLISRLEHLNSFLVTLLDNSQLRRLQDTMSSAYLEILQIRNDVKSLTSLVKALGPASVNTSSTNQFILRGVASEATETQERQYLQRLVEIKLQLAKADQVEAKTSLKLDASLCTPLKLDGFQFDEPYTCGDLQQRTIAIYNGNGVWVEWKDSSSIEDSYGNSNDVEIRMSLLADLLCNFIPTGFRAPPCLGYLNAVDSNGSHHFGFVFKKPPFNTGQSRLITLQELLEERPIPSLSARLTLCATLARCIYSFHSVNWLHKGLRADNILFFASSPKSVDLSLPFVSGFDLARPGALDSLTEKPRYDPFKDIYRHPYAQSFHTDGNFRKCYDIYSLGVMLFEIGIWKRIDKVVGFENLSSIKPTSLRNMQQWLLGKPAMGKAAPSSVANKAPYLEQLGAACGDGFRHVVLCCLTADEVENTQFSIDSADSAEAIAVGMQRFTEHDIVKRLENIANIMQECI